MVKMVIVVRSDIKMGKGKIAAQVAHAAVSLVISIINSDNSRWKEWLNEWLQKGQPKIVVKANSLDEIILRSKKAETMNLPFSIIEDAGKTQLEPGTITCLGIGPAPESLIDPITGDLKLL
ncbi:peptidyl-tRNA hydrolase Pth2 [Sulfolobus sp. E11-6]|uniref:peptidyl-tRNA hydrolase Pth2 n=1 Tax=Sulfolobus sp. E11-6 TaxID=2663020 RepID=UPI001294DC05|nr:peptidyl-tRNA hydrolase Pth2 [Sulfolobus sp. E11-6]QGA67844.1 peptidyl-tRNA hydrolase [Sulfolobus sp. E11-6]